MISCRREGEREEGGGRRVMFLLSPNDQSDHIIFFSNNATATASIGCPQGQDRSGAMREAQ